MMDFVNRNLPFNMIMLLMNIVTAMLLFHGQRYGFMVGAVLLVLYYYLKVYYLIFFERSNDGNNG